MMRIFGVGGMLFDLLIQVVILTYAFPFLLAMIALHFFREGIRVMFRGDLSWVQRRAAAGYQVGQGALGLAASVVVFITIFYRKELLQCVTGHF